VRVAGVMERGQGFTLLYTSWIDQPQGGLYN
jgi:hypothetical protein